MAEGLATAASGIAVLTIAVQLAESVKKLCDFWNSIKEAPEDIQAISLDLELLSSVLTRIADETQHVEPDATLVASLNGCWAKVKILTTLLNDIEPGFASTSLRIRKWSALKAVLKHGQLMKFQAALERLKGTLLLVQQNQHSRLSRNQHISLERSLVSITQSVSSLSVLPHSEIAETVPSIASDAHSNLYRFRGKEWDATTFPAGNLQPAQSDHLVPDGSWQQHAWVKRTLKVERSVMEYFLGTVRAESNTQLRTARKTSGLTPYYEQDQYEHETSYTIYPAAWLIRLGVQYGLNLRFSSSSTQGWKTTLKAVCPVPDDALIFEFCKEGNVPAVRKLLSRGHASVRDTDSRGYTPLHFAAQNYHSELCKILSGAGADMSAIAHNALTNIALMRIALLRHNANPMTLAAYEAYHITDAMLPKVINTFRLFIDSMDFLDEMGNGWDIFDSLCDSSNAANGDRDAKISLLLWMLRLLSFELKTYFVRQRFLRMLNWTIHPDPRLEEASTLLLNLGGAEIIDAPFFGTDGYTILHRNVAYATDGEVSATLARGPDLYRLGIDYDYTPQYESPTSLAMYSSWAFADWLRELIAIEVDTEELIGQELERNPWVHPGWEKETLRDLFAYRYRPDLDFRDCWTCSDCTGRSISFVKVQPYWRHLLERIKQRIDPDRPEQAASEVDETENADVRNIAEPTSSSNNLAHGTYTTETLLLDALNELSSESELEQEPGLASEPESEKESEEDEDVHGYPETISIRSECIYDWNEVVCVDCWLRYRRTGTRPPPGARKRRFALYFDDDSPLDEYSPAGDESSEDEYSPYLIHS